MNQAAMSSNLDTPPGGDRTPARLKHPLPRGRTLEQVWNHYQVEKALAARLKRCDREGRRRLFETMYDELFAAVPDHPRLAENTAPARTAELNRAKTNLLRRWLRPDALLVEFAPGDCEFAGAIAGQVRRVIGVDISDQRAPGKRWPDNFELLVYDGYALPQVAPGSVDVIFSHQFLEHLHPQDTLSHLALAHSLLKPGGCYVIHTPHAASGPWDVSRYFCDEPEGFHLKEWTYGELRACARGLGYSRVEAVVAKRGFNVTLPYAYFTSTEAMLRAIGRRRARRIAQRLIPDLMCVAHK
jgi:SAM-dependent methyltransferase